MNRRPGCAAAGADVKAAAIASSAAKAVCFVIARARSRRETTEQSARGQGKKQRDARWRRIGEGKEATARVEGWMAGSEKQKTRGAWLAGWLAGLGFPAVRRGAIYRSCIVAGGVFWGALVHRARKGHRFCNSGSGVFALVDKLAKITAQLGRPHVIIARQIYACFVYGTLIPIGGIKVS